MGVTFDPVKHDDIMTAILKNVRDGLNEEADKLIEEKVSEFREQLIDQKNLAVAEMMRSIEVHSEREAFADRINFNIIIRPTRFLNAKL